MRYEIKCSACGILLEYFNTDSSLTADKKMKEAKCVKCKNSNAKSDYYEKSGIQQELESQRYNLKNTIYPILIEEIKNDLYDLIIKIRATLIVRYKLEESLTEISELTKELIEERMLRSTGTPSEIRNKLELENTLGRAHEKYKAMILTRLRGIFNTSTNEIQNSPRYKQFVNDTNECFNKAFGKYSEDEIRELFKH